MCTLYLNFVDDTVALQSTILLKNGAKSWVNSARVGQNLQEIDPP